MDREASNAANAVTRPNRRGHAYQLVCASIGDSRL